MGDIRNFFLKGHSQNSAGASKTTKKEEAPKKEVKVTKASPKTDEAKSTRGTKKETKANVEVTTKGRGKRANDSAGTAEPSPKKPRASKASAKTAVKDEDDIVDDFEEEEQRTSSARKRGRGGGRGSGSAGRGSGASAEKAKPAEKPKAAGRGRGGFRNFGAREAPPHKGEKEVPEGAEDALAGLTFVISGTLDSLEREEAEDLIKRHGGRITSAVSKKTSFLLADEDIGGVKSQKATDLGIPFLTEDGLFDKIRASKPKPAPTPASAPAPPTKAVQHDNVPDTSAKKSNPVPVEKKLPPKPKASSSGGPELETWPSKHKPKSTNDIIANQSIVKQLKDWLVSWDKNHNSPAAGKGKKPASSSPKAALLSGPPGCGKTTTARLLCQELGLEAIEVNASDNRGKADSKIRNGLGGSTSNAVKELVNNSSISGNGQAKAALIMDEVDGMSAGDRGGVADLILTMKKSKIPIICICNDRYSQKLKSLVNYCLVLSYRKPTKQQMAKRLQEVAKAEGLQIDAIALEELAERTHGDMRLALNQLQYMSLRSNVLKYNDVKAYSTASSKDEDISPFSAVDKLMGFEGGRLKLDDRIDFAMSDMDLVPLIIQENYLNFYPSGAGKDSSGTARMDLIARAATSIADGDVINVQIRRYRQWQLSRSSAFMSSIMPAALMHGRREVFSQGERNFNRFGGWLGKNSTFGKNKRLLGEIQVHVLASHAGHPNRRELRLDYFPVLSKRVTQPLHTMEKADAVQAVLDVMDAYSLTQQDVETMLSISKQGGQPDLMQGVPAAVKAAVTRGYTQRFQNRPVKSADLLPAVPGQKKGSKKKAAAAAPDDAEGEELLEEDVLAEGGATNEGGEDDESEENENSLDALKKSKAGYEINIAEETKPGKRTTTPKTKQKASPAQAKGASSSKGAGTKRKR